MSKKQDFTKGLETTHISDAADKALNQIGKERSGEQLGLYTRWRSMNILQGKYFRFNHVNLIAAPSGHGKSYLLNTMLDDFTNPELNGDFANNIIVLVANYEMTSSDEVIRMLGRDIGKSYSYILSSEYDRAMDDFNRITDAQFAYIERRIQQYKRKPIYYINLSGNLIELFYTAYHLKKKHPGKELVLAIDHYLLSKKLHASQSDLELISDTAHMAVTIRQNLRAMLLILGQANNKIEEADRRSKLSLHFPVRSDIYAINQLYWACDNVWFAPYLPERIHIPYFSPQKYKTKDLAVFCCIKARKGNAGILYMKNLLDTGTFATYSRDELEAIKADS